MLAFLVGPTNASGQVPRYWHRDVFDWMPPGPLAGRNGWSLAGGVSAQVGPLPQTCGALAVDPPPGQSVAMWKSIAVPSGSVQELAFRVRVDRGGTRGRLDLE